MRYVLVSIAMLLVSSCAGVRCHMTADSISEPVSFTSHILDRDGAVHTVDPDDVVHHFKLRNRRWAMFWRSANLTARDWDVSDILRNEIEENSGDAIANLQITTSDDFFLLWYFASLIPIIPDYMSVTIEGDVVCLGSTDGS